MNLGYQFENSIVQFNALLGQTDPPTDVSRTITDFRGDTLDQRKVVKAISLIEITGKLAVTTNTISVQAPPFVRCFWSMMPKAILFGNVSMCWTTATTKTCFEKYGKGPGADHPDQLYLGPCSGTGS